MRAVDRQWLVLLPMLLLKVHLSAAQRYERLRFNATELRVPENGGQALLHIVRDCEGAACESTVSVVVSTDTDLRFRLPGTVRVREGQRHVHSSHDLRRWLHPGSWVRVFGADAQLDPGVPVDADAFVLSRPFRSDNVRGYFHGVRLPLPGTVDLVHGSAFAVSTWDLRQALSVGDVVRVGEAAFTIAGTGPYNATHIPLEQPWLGVSLQGQRAFASEPYALLQESTGTRDVRVRAQLGSTSLQINEDVRSEVHPGELLKVGTRNYEVVSITATQVTIWPALLQTLDDAGEAPHVRHLRVPLAGRVCTVAGELWMHTTADLRPQLSVGDPVRAGGQLLFVAQPATARRIAITHPARLTLDQCVPAFTSKRYVPLRGRLSLLHDAHRANITLAVLTRDVRPGDLVKVLSRNYFVAVGGAAAHDHITISPAFRGEEWDEPAFAALPTGDATATPGADFEPMRARVSFPRNVVERSVVVTLLDDWLAEVPHEHFSISLWDARYEDPEFLPCGRPLDGVLVAIAAGHTTAITSASLEDVLEEGDHVHVAGVELTLTAHPSPNTLTFLPPWPLADVVDRTLCRARPSVPLSGFRARIIILNDDTATRQHALPTNASTQPGSPWLRVAADLRAALQPRDVVAIDDLQGSFTVQEVAKDGIRVHPVPTAAAAGILQRTSMPDGPGVLEFASAVFLANETHPAAARDANGQMAPGHAVVQLRRTGGLAGWAAVRVRAAQAGDSCELAPEERAALGRKRGFAPHLPGSGTLIPGLPFVATTRPLAHRLTDGDVIAVGYHVYTVLEGGAHNDTHIALGAPHDAAAPVPHAGEAVRDAPIRRLAVRMPGVASVVAGMRTAYFSEPLQHHITGGDVVLVGSTVVRLADQPVSDWSGHALGPLRAQVATTPDSGTMFTNRDLRPGFEQQMLCRARSGWFRLHLGTQHSAPIPANATARDLEAALRFLDDIISAKVSIDEADADAPGAASVCRDSGSAPVWVSIRVVEAVPEHSLPAFTADTQGLLSASGQRGSVEVRAMPHVAPDSFVLVAGVPHRVRDGAAADGQQQPVEDLYNLGGATNTSAVYRAMPVRLANPLPRHSELQAPLLALPLQVDLNSTAGAAVDSHGQPALLPQIDLRLGWRQRCHCDATGGKFALQLGSSWSSTIAWDASADDIAAAIMELPGVLRVSAQVGDGDGKACGLGGRNGFSIHFIDGATSLGAELDRLAGDSRMLSHEKDTPFVRCWRVPGLRRGDPLVVGGSVNWVSHDARRAFNASVVPLALPVREPATNMTITLLDDRDLPPADYEALGDTTFVEFAPGVATVPLIVPLYSHFDGEHEESILLTMDEPRALCSDPDCSHVLALTCWATGGQLWLSIDGAVVSFAAGSATLQDLLDALTGLDVAAVVTGDRSGAQLSDQRICTAQPDRSVHLRLRSASTVQQASLPELYVVRDWELEGLARVQRVLPHPADPAQPIRPTIGPQNCTRIVVSDTHVNSGGVFSFRHGRVEATEANRSAVLIIDRAAGWGGDVLVHVSTRDGLAVGATSQLRRTEDYDFVHKLGADADVATAFARMLTNVGQQTRCCLSRGC